MIPIVNNLNETVTINNEDSNDGKFTKIGNDNYTVSGTWTVNDVSYSEKYAIISHNIVLATGTTGDDGDKYYDLSFKDSTETWVSLQYDSSHGEIEIVITDGIGTITQDDNTYTTTNISDGYILSENGEFGLWNIAPYGIATGVFNVSGPLIAISMRQSDSSASASIMGITNYNYMEFEKSDIVYSISLCKNGPSSTYDIIGTIVSFNENNACSYEVANGYIQYTITNRIDITQSYPSSQYNTTTVAWFLYPLSIDITLTKEGSEYDLIRMIPVIMIAGVVIASIGAFVINRRE